MGTGGGGSLPCPPCRASRLSGGGKLDTFVVSVGGRGAFVRISFGAGPRQGGGPGCVTRGGGGHHDRGWGGGEGEGRRPGQDVRDGGRLPGGLREVSAEVPPGRAPQGPHQVRERRQPLRLRVRPRQPAPAPARRRSPSPLRALGRGKHSIAVVIGFIDRLPTAPYLWCKKRDYPQSGGEWAGGGVRPPPPPHTPVVWPVTVRLRVGLIFPRAIADGSCCWAPLETNRFRRITPFPSEGF